MNRAEKEPENYPAIMKHLSPRFVMKAKMELFETPETVDLRVKEVKNLLAKDHDVKSEWFTDEDIIMYLRGRKYDVEKAVTCMKKLVAFIKKRPKLFEPVDEKILETIVKEEIFWFLPYRTKKGVLIGLSKLRKWEPSAICIDEIFKCLCLGILYCTAFPMTQVNGGMLIFDFKAPFWKYIRYHTPFNVYMLFQILMECAPIRVKALHLLNANGLTKMVLPVVCSLLSEKLRKRIFIHNDQCDLRNFIDEDVLPSEYGGKLSKQERLELVDISKITMPDYATKIVNYFKSESYS